MNAPSNVKKVSVIIPTYNRESILPKAIESVLRQTYPAIELIVIDDGSKDNTKQLVESYPGITYVFQENGGQGKARNTGLELATGYYLASLDSDDTWEPDFLSVCISKLEKDGLDFVFANWTQVMIDGTSIDFFKHTRMLEHYGEGDSNGWVNLEYDKLRSLYLEKCPSPTSSLVFRRESLYGKWQENMNIADDWCLILDMILFNKCNAAFNFRKLWSKTVDGKNIYDGRNETEVLELLYIRDMSHIIGRVKKALTYQEKKVANDKIAENIFKLLQRRKFKFEGDDKKLAKKAIKLNRKILYKIVGQIMTNQIISQIISIKRTLSRVKRKIIPKNG